MRKEDKKRYERLRKKKKQREKGEDWVENVQQGDQEKEERTKEKKEERRMEKRKKRREKEDKHLLVLQEGERLFRAHSHFDIVKGGTQGFPRHEVSDKQEVLFEDVSPSTAFSIPVDELKMP